MGKASGRTDTMLTIIITVFECTTCKTFPLPFLTKRSILRGFNCTKNCHEQLPSFFAVEKRIEIELIIGSHCRLSVSSD